MTDHIIPSEEFLYSGPRFPRVLFVLNDVATPTPAEMLRAEPLVNEDAARFAKRYCEPLGMKRDRDVGIAWCKNAAWEELHEAITMLQPEAIVTLGDTIITKASQREVLTLRAFAREHDVWKDSHREEVDRKLKALRKILDAKSASLRPCLRPLLKAARPHDAGGIESNAKVARLFKADAPKRIVYGAVLDPYQIDLQGDWIPVADVEETAHAFLAKRGYVSDRHEAIAEGNDVVESFVEPYPSEDDYRRALAGLPHRAFKRKFGGDEIHSGAWVLAVKLTPTLWSDYQRGELNAFSIEGWGNRSPMQTSDFESFMRGVTFVELETV